MARRYYWPKADHPNYMGFRNGPVPYTGVRKFHCRWWSPRNMRIRERSLLGDNDHYKYTRAARRAHLLPDPWDDTPRARRSLGWKEQGKRRRPWVKR